MQTRTTICEPKLWWIAGADSRILSECPRADQIFIQHLGISLIGAFLFVFLITAISILVAFPDLAGSRIATGLALGSALLIATMVFLIDRLFIQADWNWQAAKQRRELARATWDTAPLHEQLTVTAGEFHWRPQSAAFMARLTIISFRVLLSAAIGLTIASFVELVIYKDELKPLIQRLHYEDNRAIYDEITARTASLDQEIAIARNERDRLLAAKVDLEAELNKLQLAPASLLSDRETSGIDAQIAELRSKIAEEELNARRYARDMVGEFRGTMVNPDNSGIAGPGRRYWTALDLKTDAESAIAEQRKKIADLEAEKTRALANRDVALRIAGDQFNARKAFLDERLKNVADALRPAQAALSDLQKNREATLDAFVVALKAKPDFVPLSYGIASQFRALRKLYREYESTFEMYMIKILIMVLEMTPVLQKVFLSPTTLYAVKLDAAKRTRAYVDFDEELRLRQEYLRRKADVAMDEALDEKGIERIRQGNVMPLHEGRGAG